MTLTGIIRRDIRLGAALRAPAFWAIAGGIALITSLHYLTDIHFIPYHSIYRSLYYLPIALAAVRYGLRGGLAAALAIAAVYLPHVLHALSIVRLDAVNDLLETALFVGVGALAGALADAERAQRRRAQQMAALLTEANARLPGLLVQAERTRARVASILDSLESGVVTISGDGCVAVANRAAVDLLAALGPHADSVLAALPADSAGCPYRREQTIAGRVLSLRAAPLRGTDDTTVGTVLVLDDLTELRALEEQVQRAQRLASLGRLAGGLAHEVRNPLGIVRATAQLLQQEAARYPALALPTQVIQAEIDRVDRLIEQLLDYARPQPPRSAPLDLAALARHAVAITEPLAAQRGVGLSIEAPAALAPLEGDAERLHQAVINLLLNAVQATPAGGQVAVSLREVYRGSDAQVVLTVCDTGAGIAPEDLPRLFEPFFTTRDDGVGLGLSLVQQIAAEHGGTVRVASRPGAGAAFTIELPRRAPAGELPRAGPGDAGPGR